MNKIKTILNIFFLMHVNNKIFAMESEQLIEKRFEKMIMDILDEASKDEKNQHIKNFKEEGLIRKYNDYEVNKKELEEKRIEYKTLMAHKIDILSKLTYRQEASVKEKILTVIYQVCLFYNVIHVIQVVNFLYLKNNFIKNIIETIAFNENISIKLLVASSLITYVCLQLKNYYLEVKNTVLDKTENEVVESLEKIKNEIKEIECVLTNLEKIFTAISVLLGQDLAAIIKNASLAFSKMRGIPIEDAMADVENKKLFANRKEAFFTAILPFIKLLSSKEISAIYSQFTINPPEIQIYNNSAKFELAKDLYGEHSIRYVNGISNTILKKFKSTAASSDDINYLFSGVAGTGKTQAMYNIIKNIISSLEADETVVCIPILASNLMTASDLEIIREQIKYYLKPKQYVIVIIDEIDACIKNRANLHANNLSSEFYNITTKFLNFIDFFLQYKVAILSSTNHHENIDAAVIRSGRNNHEIFYLPNAEERNEIIFKVLKNDKNFSELEKTLKNEYEDSFNTMAKQMEEHQAQEGGKPAIVDAVSFGYFDCLFLSALITFLTTKLSIANTINTTTKILEYIFMKEDDFTKFSNSVAGLKTGDNWWVNKLQRKKTPIFAGIKERLQIIMFGLLDRPNAKDMILFITEDLIPARQLDWSEKVKKLRAEIESKKEDITGRFLAFAARRDSVFPEIKRSSIKFLNPETLCPNIDSEYLLTTWHREYAYRNKPGRQKLELTYLPEMQLLVNFSNKNSINWEWFNKNQNRKNIGTATEVQIDSTSSVL
jgi:hypothetical protein